MRFKDKVVWITGASSGIGEALAHEFSREGAKLILSSRRENELERVRNACQGPVENISIRPLDLIETGTLAEKAAVAESLFGRIDILVNNGGISQRSLVKDTLLDVELKIMDTNFTGTIALTKAVLPGMLSRRSGQIVVISSLVGYLDVPSRATYSASKHALQGYFNSLRSELWRDSIKVTIICPGYIKTDISINALKADGTRHDVLDSGQSRGMPADKCARKIVNAVYRGREEVLVGGVDVLAVYLKRFLPFIYSQVVRRVMASQ